MTDPLKEEELNKALASLLKDDSVVLYRDDDENIEAGRIRSSDLIDYIWIKTRQLESELQDSSDSVQVQEELERVVKLSYIVTQRGHNSPKSPSQLEVRQALRRLENVFEMQLDFEPGSSLDDDDFRAFYEEIERLDSELSATDKARIMCRIFIILVKNLLDDDFARTCIAFVLTSIYFHIRGCDPSFGEMMNVVTYWILVLSVLSGLFDTPDVG